MTTKLIQFTLLIPISNRQREFNFRQRTPELYDGNTTDERGERYYFTMINENGHWIFGNHAMPAWLKSNEAQVADAIADPKPI